jgi:hypothetical protein
MKPDRIDLHRPDVAEDERRCNRKTEAVLRFFGVAWHRTVRAERHRFAEALDRNSRDVAFGEPVRALEIEGRLDGGLRPATYGIRLEILLANTPSRAKINVERRGVVAFDRQGRRAGKAVAGE